MAGGLSLKSKCRWLHVHVLCTCVKFGKSVLLWVYTKTVSVACCHVEMLGRCRKPNTTWLVGGVNTCGSCILNHARFYVYIPRPRLSCPTTHAYTYSISGIPHISTFYLLVCTFNCNCRHQIFMHSASTQPASMMGLSTRQIPYISATIVLFAGGILFFAFPWVYSEEL